MRTWFNRCAMALGGALTLFTLAGSLPAHAASEPAPPGVRVLPAAALPGNFVAPPAPPAAGQAVNPEKLRQAVAYLRAHPILGSVTVRPRTSSLPGPTAIHAASAWPNWWGVRVYLTSADLRNLFYALTIYGFSAVADAICAPTGFMAFACGAAGLIMGYIVAQAVWNTWGYRGGCGLYIDIQWSLYWRTWGC
jgi:hypothetical protein